MYIVNTSAYLQTEHSETNVYFYVLRIFIIPWVDELNYNGSECDISTPSVRH